MPFPVKSYIKKSQQKESPNPTKKGGCWKNIIKGLSYGFLLFIALTIICYIFEPFKPPIQPNPTKHFYANDYGNYLSQNVESFIIREGAALCDKTKAQIVVAVIPETGSDTLESYSRDLANKWGIGDKELNNGILLLFVDGKKPRVRLEVGRGLEGVINDAKAGRILDQYAVKAKNKRNYNKAAFDTFKAIAKILYKHYNLPYPDSLDINIPLEINTEKNSIADAPFTQPDSENYSTENRIFESMVTAFALMIIIGILIVIIGLCFLGGLIGESSGGSSYSSGGYSSGGSSGGHSGGGGSFGGGGASR